MRRIIPKVLFVTAIVLLVVSFVFNLVLLNQKHDLSKQINGYKDGYESCEVSLQATYDDNTILQESIADRDSQITSLQKEVSSLKSEITSLKKN